MPRVTADRWNNKSGIATSDCSATLDKKYMDCWSNGKTPGLPPGNRRSAMRPVDLKSRERRVESGERRAESGEPESVSGSQLLALRSPLFRARGSQLSAVPGS